MLLRKLIFIPLVFCLWQPASAAVSFINYTTATSASATSRTPAEPTSTAENDLVLAVCAFADDDGTWTDPADFTEIENYADITGSDRTTYVGYKVRGATAGNGYAFSHSGIAEAIRCSLFTFRGVDTSTPIDVTYVRATHYNATLDTTNTTPKSITTNTNTAWVVIANVITGGNGSTTLGAPTSYDLRSTGDNDDNIGVVVATREIATAGAVSPGAWAHTGGNGFEDPVNVTIALQPSEVPPSFTAGPTYAAAANGFTIGGTVDINATVYAVAVNPGAATPNCTQVQAATDGSDVAAAISANEAWTGTSADSFALTVANKWVRYDVHICATAATGDSVVTSASDQNRSADANQTIVVLTSISATSIFALATDVACDTTSGSPILTGCADTSDFQRGDRLDVSAGFADLTDLVVLAVTSSTITVKRDANATSSNITVTKVVFYNSSVASGDVIEHDDTVVCSAGTDAVTWAVDGDFSYTATCGSTLTTLDYCIQDVSHASSGIFTTPACWATDDKVYLFNTAPVCDSEPTGILWLTEDAAMAEEDFLPLCNDADGQALTATVFSGVLHNGLSFSAAGSLSGTPDIEDESGVTYRLKFCDLGELCDTIDDRVIYVVNTVQTPDFTVTDLTGALALYDGAWPWNAGDRNFTATFTCGAEAVNEVLSQTPAAAGEVGAEQAVTVIVSTGACGASLTGAKIGVRGPRIGL